MQFLASLSHFLLGGLLCSFCDFGECLGCLFVAESFLVASGSGHVLGGLEYVFAHVLLLLLCLCEGFRIWGSAFTEGIKLGRDFLSSLSQLGGLFRSGFSLLLRLLGILL